ncbi:tetratricopeptide (TPR) repeat protein [Clostridium punense]|uniref:Tetratricopeptide (TPR) repeat protein n=2 Tax=Clostridium TaxID=1485 RepID=A0ABS4K250_9CLOT|nr:helix-turn-helix transcriptional regulator [Clostridium punense]MBP2021865.1 tetratricopeptide (TPR) repeat protein [Clostridium punense]
MEFLPPGKRIKKIRKQLKMKQDDFQDENMTRGYFGMIEVGTRKLNKKTARFIAQKLNKKAEELGVELNIDENYLLMSEEDEARNYCEEKLENNPSEGEIREVISIGEKYSLKKSKAEAYKALGDIRYKELKFGEAFISYSEAADVCKEINESFLQGYVNNRLGMCKYNELDYEEALLYYNRARLTAAASKDIEVETNATFNMALCYSRLEMSDEAMESIDLYLSKIQGREDYNEKYIIANILKANCLESKGMLQEAIEILENLVQGFEGIKKMDEAVIYNNIGVFYLEKDELDESLKAFSKSETIRMEYDEEYLSHTIIDKSRVYIKRGLYTEAIILLKLGVDLATRYNDNNYLLRGYYLLIDIYEKLDKHKDVEDIYFKILGIVEKVNNSCEKMKVYLSLTEYYIKQNNMEKALKYLEESKKNNRCS